MSHRRYEKEPTMPNSDYGDRLTELGFKRITIFVRPDRAELVKAQENAHIADDLVEIALSISEDEGGISDDRIDFFTGQRPRGLPATVDLDFQYEGIEDKKSKQAKELKAVYQMVIDAYTYIREHDTCAKIYAKAAPGEKFAAGLRYRLAFAKMYAFTRKAVTYHRLYQVKYERATDDTTDERSTVQTA